MPSKTFAAFRDSAIDAWVATAPSYVTHEQQPLDGKLRRLYEDGCTTTQFREAIELAFANHNVERLKCLSYAYGIIQRQLSDAHQYQSQDTYTAALWRDDPDVTEQLRGMRLIEGNPASTLRFRYAVAGMPWVEVFVLFDEVPVENVYGYKFVYSGPLEGAPEAD